jgi:putative transposase
MRRAGPRGVSRRRVPTTTRREPTHRPANDLAGRVFRAPAPNTLWGADITYVPTAAGFLFLAVVLDALDKAVTTRKPADVVHHSDQGSQHTSLAFGMRCQEAGVRPSTGSGGDAYDDPLAEAFLATLECELLDRRRLRSQAEARMAMFQFMEGFYSPARRCPSLGYLSLIEFEARKMLMSDGPPPTNRPRKRGNFNPRGCPPCG